MRIKRPVGMKNGQGPKRITLTAMDDAEDLKPIGRATRADLGARMKDQIRADSIRAYRRRIDEAIHWVRLGRMSPKDGQSYAAVIKTAAELLMTEKVMAAAGQTDDAPLHPEGADGGLALQDTAPNKPRLVKVERSVGTDAKGNPINITTVTMEGGEDLADETALLTGGVEPAALEPPEEEEL